MLSDFAFSQNRLTPRSHWDKYWQGDLIRQTYDADELWFKDLFARHVGPGTRCFEVGCFPGRYMVYLAKQHGCHVSGIDFTSHFEHMLSFFHTNGVKPAQLFNEDFLTFEADQEYDFVYSLGFLEHFTNFEEIIARHTQLVRPGGILFLECPNYAGPVQYLLHSLLARHNLQGHYLPSMNLRKWRQVLEENRMQPIHHGYYRTFAFWVGRYQGRLSRFSRLWRRFFYHRLVRGIARLGGHIDRAIDFPNRWTSPFLVSISVKKSTWSRRVTLFPDKD